MNTKTVLITGANRGIGFEIARQLGEEGHQVILTSRNKEKGEEATHTLSGMGYNIDFLQLDVSDNININSFIGHFKDRIGRLDVLINNAGVYLDGNQLAWNVDFDILERTFETNFMGPWRLINVLVPFLNESPDPRIVNISSGMGAFTDMGPGYPSYRISKTALNALTKILSAELSKIKVNAMCPGWVKTEMGGPNASRTVEKGAETAVWLATAPNISSGGFYRDMKLIDW